MEVKNMRYAAFSVLLILVAYIFSLEIRSDNFAQKTGAQGLEATYHVLWTARALAQSTAENHYYLPTVTQAPGLGNPFVWGATVLSRGGSYVYTSFPPLSFLLPYELFSWRSQGIEFSTLSLLNSLIGLSSAVAMGALARAVTRSLIHGSKTYLQSEWVVFTTVSILYLFLRESLVSHGAVYWPHSLSQLTLIIGAFMAYKVFEGRDTILSNAILLLALFIYPALEWTGFVFAVGVSIALLINWRLIRRRPDQARSTSTRSLLLAIAALLLPALSGIALIAHFSIAIGLDNLLDALSSRATARTFDFRALFGLVPAYLVSFGALLPLAFLAGVQIRRNNMLPFSEAKPEHLLFLVVAFPMFENVILMQHAYQFSFDRLKLAVLLLLVVVVFLVRLKDQNRNVYVLATVSLILYSNIQIFSYDNLYYQRWGGMVAANNRLVAEFREDPRSDCVIMGSSSQVRGYLNVVLDRDIVEHTNAQELSVLADKSDLYCGFGLIETRHDFVDLPMITRIQLFDENGRVVGRFVAGEQG